MKLPDTLTAEIITSIDTALRSGMTIEDVAKAWEVSRPTLVNRLLRHGKEIHPSRFLRDVEPVTVS